MKISEFANNVDLDEVVVNDTSSKSTLFAFYALHSQCVNIFLKFADKNFVVCFLVVNELTHIRQWGEPTS